MTKKNSRHRKFETLGLIHLGCPKNQVDSEEMLATLAQDGWTLVGDADDADVLVVNTCAFIDAAKEESIAAIGDALRKKNSGRCSKVIVTGCLAQRYAHELATEMPDVDAVIGLGHTEQLPAYVRSTFRGNRPVISTPPPPEWQEIGARLLTTPPWTTYLKIGEGCDHRCSFCAIPSFRGDWRSRPAKPMLNELRFLVGQGLKEAILVGQDSTLYGSDTRGEWNLPKLVRAIDGVDGIRWQRLMYAHPGRITREMIDLFGDVQTLAPYIDMPFQHGDDGMLKRMRRAGSTGRYLDVVGQLRQRVPHIAIRSTILLGFPGETDREFDNTCEFVRRARLDHLGVFVYSEEDGTDSAEMESKVPRELAEERADRLMAIQQAISEEKLRDLLGEQIEVLVEAPDGVGHWLGRSRRDAPEVDGSVFLVGDGVAPGDIVTAEVVETAEHDITARVASG